MITSSLQAEIEHALKRRITAIAPLSAANMAQIYRLSFEGGLTAVAKVAEKGLDLEAWMLNYLRTKTKTPVPNVHYFNEHVIIMDFVESQFSIDMSAQQNAAEILAEMHKITSPHYGFERDTVVGSLHQPNPENKDWVDFFTNQRLLYMAKAAQMEGKIDAKMMKQIEKLAGKLPSYIKAPNPPGLVHGDIWDGNVLAARGKITAFIDPAIYFADPEIELSFILLFNTLDRNFFARYNEINPIKAGFFEERSEIYKIYPLLVHTRLFGISYARKVQKILDRFLG